MNIENKNNVSVLRIRHKGAEANWMCHLKQCEPFDVYSNPTPSDVARIEFDDLQEVNALIDILTEFKKGVETGVIGIWKKGL